MGLEKWNTKYDETTSTVLILQGAVLEGRKSLDPKVITVVLGKNNTVLWTNGDDTSHTLVSDNGGAEMWSTEMMKPGVRIDDDDDDDDDDDTRNQHQPALRPNRKTQTDVAVLFIS